MPIKDRDSKTLEISPLARLPRFFLHYSPQGGLACLPVGRDGGNVILIKRICINQDIPWYIFL
jgi:hypothetical protein